MQRTWCISLGFSCFLVLGACAESSQKAETQTPAPVTSKSPAEAPPPAKQETPVDKANPVAEPPMVSIPNARLFENNLVGGALTLDLIREAHEGGYMTVVNLRTAEEGGVDEQRALAEELGMSYVHIPISGPADLTKENAASLDKALSNPGAAVVHCKSGNRVGALFGLRARFIQGKSPEEAMAIASEAGVTSLKEAAEAVISAK